MSLHEDLCDPARGAASRGVALLPIGGPTADDPLTALLAAREGFALGWDDRPGAMGPLLHTLPPTALIATGLVAAAEAARAGTFVAGSGTLFQAIIPAGQSLVASSAVPGGFLGATTAAGSSSFAGAAAFVPVTATAIGPALGAAALATAVIGVQLWSHHQMSQQLKRLESKIDDVRSTIEGRSESQLVSAIDALDQATLAWMDDPSQDLHALVPGFDAAAHEIRTHRTHARKSLMSWQRELDGLASAKDVNVSAFKKSLFGGPSKDPRSYLPYQLVLADVALGSHQRLLALQHGIATAREQSRAPLSGFRARLTGELELDAQLRSDLRKTIDALVRLPLVIRPTDGFSDEPIRIVQTLLRVHGELPPESDARETLDVAPQTLNYRVAEGHAVEILGAA